MKGRLPAEFYARMMGGFFLYFQGRELEMHLNQNTKYMQFLMILLRAGMEGVERRTLIDLIRHDTEPEKRVNNFYQQMFLLRKVIARCHFPEGRYIVKQKGRYYFTLDYTLETDAHELDLMIEEIRKKAGLEEREERRERLWAFCQSYTGEFLPMLEGEEWVAQESAYYQRWYFQCLEELCRILEEEDEQGKRLQLAAAASQIYPYDGWQKIQIECLMRMGRRKEALAVYEQASRRFYGELGVNPLDEVMERYQKESGKEYHAANEMLEIISSLAEPESGQEAYFCSYPSFVDACRLIVRNGERLRKENLLMACTLLEDEKWVLGKWTERMECLQKVLASALRTEDVYTRYGKQQFIVLLVGAGKKDGRRIAQRLEKGWEKEYLAGGTTLSLEIQEADGLAVEEGKDEGERYLCSTYHQP